MDSLWLRVLKMWMLENLEDWFVDEGVMPQLGERSDAALDCASHCIIRDRKLEASNFDEHAMTTTSVRSFMLVFDHFLVRFLY